MKKKILALAFVAAMTLGLAKKAESGSGTPCQTVVIWCFTLESGTGIVCDLDDLNFLVMHICNYPLAIIHWPGD